MPSFKGCNTQLELHHQISTTRSAPLDQPPGRGIKRTAENIFRRVYNVCPPSASQSAPALSDESHSARLNLDQNPASSHLESVSVFERDDLQRCGGRGVENAAAVDCLAVAVWTACWCGPVTSTASRGWAPMRSP
eukprot:350082-Chlamydomonas_euryale.AAC.2